MLQAKGGICEPSLDIPLNGDDMQSVFGYKVLGEMPTKGCVNI
ncbi:MAG: hypothetical protein WBE22_10325 [Halobacteriota archaeon]